MERATDDRVTAFVIIATLAIAVPLLLVMGWVFFHV
jgi:hypothetical protein